MAFHTGELIRNNTSATLFLICDYKLSNDTVLIKNIDTGVQGYIHSEYLMDYEQVDAVDFALEQKVRANVYKQIIAGIKSHLDDLWMNGDAAEHEFTFNMLKHIEKLERGGE